jgi:hypothetical protein
MAGRNDDSSTFRLLCDEYALFLRLTGSSDKLADKLVRRFLEEGERDHAGRIRYKIWEIEALPGGLTPGPYDGAFWRSDPGRGINCTIEPWNSSARWTGPVSARWKEFDGREVADYQVSGIRLNHDIVLEFLENAGLPSGQTEPREPSTAQQELEETPEPEPPENSPPKSRKTTLKDWLPDAVKRLPRPRGEKDYAGYLSRHAPQPWSKHSIQNTLSQLSVGKKSKPKKR